MNSSSSPSLANLPLFWQIFLCLASPLSGILAVFAKIMWDKFISHHKMETDDRMALTKDLLEERKTLFNQLVIERSAFTEQVTKLEARVDHLEKENMRTEQENLILQSKVKDQELQIERQNSTIKDLQGKIKKLEAHDKTTNTAQ